MNNSSSIYIKVCNKISLTNVCMCNYRMSIFIKIISILATAQLHHHQHVFTQNTLYAKYCDIAGCKHQVVFAKQWRIFTSHIYMFSLHCLLPCLFDFPTQSCLSEIDFKIVYFFVVCYFTYFVMSRAFHKFSILSRHTLTNFISQGSLFSSVHTAVMHIVFPPD